MNRLHLIFFIAAVLNFASSLPQYDTVVYTVPASQDDVDSKEYNYDTDESNERSVRDVEQQSTSSTDEGKSTSTKRPLYHLSDVIHGFEDSFVHSAIALSSAFRPELNANNQAIQKARKRSAEDITTSKENVTSKHVPAAVDREEHIAIDHVAVFKPTGFPLFSLFPNANMKATTTTTTTTQLATESSTTTQSTTQNTTSSTESTKAETASSTEATTANPMKKLKEDEDNIKDKVAEIEADPVILSARV